MIPPPSEPQPDHRSRPGSSCRCALSRPRTNTRTPDGSAAAVGSEVTAPPSDCQPDQVDPLNGCTHTAKSDAPDEHVRAGAVRHASRIRSRRIPPSEVPTRPPASGEPVLPDAHPSIPRANTRILEPSRTTAIGSEVTAPPTPEPSGRARAVVAVRINRVVDAANEDLYSAAVRDHGGIGSALASEMLPARPLQRDAAVHPDRVAASPNDGVVGRSRSSGGDSGRDLTADREPGCPGATKQRTRADRTVEPTSHGEELTARPARPQRAARGQHGRDGGGGGGGGGGTNPGSKLNEAVRRVLGGPVVDCGRVDARRVGRVRRHARDDTTRDGPAAARSRCGTARSGSSCSRPGGCRSRLAHRHSVQPAQNRLSRRVRSSAPCSRCSTACRCRSSRSRPATIHLRTMPGGHPLKPLLIAQQNSVHPSVQTEGPQSVMCT